MTYTDLGLCYFDKQDFDSALDKFQAAMSVNPDDEVSLYNLGLIYFEKKMYENAINAWQKLLKNNTSDPYVHFPLGSADEEVGLILQAKIEWEQAADMAPEGSAISNFAKEALERIRPLDNV